MVMLSPSASQPGKISHGAGLIGEGGRAHVIVRKDVSTMTIAGPLYGFTVMEMTYVPVQGIVVVVVEVGRCHVAS
jgi:hypothetical protein